MNKSAFHDLGYDSEKAFTLELKAKVLSKILQTIKKSGLTQRELSKILDQPQSRINELVKGKLSDESRNAPGVL